MSDQREWAQIEKVLIRLLIAGGHAGSDRVSVSTPGDLEEKLPFYRVTLVRGSDDGLTDSSVVDLECFGATRSMASDDAERMRRVMHSLAGRADMEGNLVDTVSTVGRPVWFDYRNPNIQRYLATYEVQTRPVYVAG